MPEIQRNPLLFFLSVTQQYGDLVKFRFAFWDSYIANHPEYIKHILVDNYRNYSKKTFDYRLLRILVGNGLLTSEGDSWLSQRRLIQPAFHRQKITGFGQIMVESAGKMLDEWQVYAQNRQPFDVSAEMMRLTLRIVGKALFGQDLNRETGLVGDAFTTANMDISKRIRSLFSAPLSLPTPRNRRFHQAIRTMDQVVQEIIQKRRAELERGALPGEDINLLTILLLAKDEKTGESMDDDQLRDEVKTLLLAGHETTANALSWAWYLLSKNPEAGHKLRAELNQVLGDRLPNTQDLPSLPYTRMVVQETLRIRPPAWIVSRLAEHEDEIGGYRIPAGSHISISPYIMHHHPGFWENPEGFDPERFTPDRSANRPAYVYFPFGGGQRMCIGRDFALTEASLILASVASRFRLDLVPGRPVDMEPSITLRPRDGIWVTAHPA